MLMSRMNMYGPKFPISIRKNKMGRVMHYYGLLPLRFASFLWALLPIPFVVIERASRTNRAHFPLVTLKHLLKRSASEFSPAEALKFLATLHRWQRDLAASHHQAR